MTDDSLLFVALVIGALVVTFIILWMRRASQPRGVARPSRRKAPRRADDWILVDGSNVMHWQDGQPQIAAVALTVRKLESLGYEPGVVFDANAGWKLLNRYLHDGDFAAMLGLERRQVLVVPKGTQADPFLLEKAREFAAKIVTNDRYRDWAEAYPEVLEPGFLIRGGARSGEVWLKGLVGVKEAAV